MLAYVMLAYRTARPRPWPLTIAYASAPSLMDPPPRPSRQQLFRPVEDEWYASIGLLASALAPDARPETLHPYIPAPEQTRSTQSESLRFQAKPGLVTIISG